MRIGFYSTPTNDKLTEYKGLYRENGLIDFCEGYTNNLIQMVKSFFLAAQDGMHIEYSDKNLKKALKLWTMLCGQKWQGDLLLFSDSCDFSVPVGFSFLGYDICADSRYYSPLGDGFLSSYAQDELFFRGMSIRKYAEYVRDLNDACLFKTRIIADDFSNYCNWINHQYPHIVESEEGWRPYAIYVWVEPRDEGIAQGTVRNH